MIKIYIACLASYNNGFLFGKWFDLDEYTDKDDLLNDINAQVLQSEENPAFLNCGENPEEWAMHDIEGIDYKYVGTEYPDLEKLIEMNEVLKEGNGEAILGLMDHMGFDSISEAKEYYDDNLLGEFKDDAEMAEYIAEEVNGWDLSEGPGRYFDAEMFARDLTMGGDVFEVNGTYFWSR